MKHVILFLALFSVTFFNGQEDVKHLTEPDSLLNSGNSISTEAFEQVPIYKGCKKNKSNPDKRNCMSDKIAQLFKDNFNTEMHEESDLIPGFKRISVIFKIDEEGKIFNINARAEDQYLEAEAIRVIKLIPQMTPGMRNGKPVIVPYSIPINVEVTPNKNEGKTKYPVYRGCDKKSNNKELEECSKQKISNFIKMSFDIEMASRVLPTEKSTQFLLEFTINKKGKIENVNARANHKAIAIEAIKVAKRLPKFKEPGIWEGVAVDTPYSLLMTLYFQ